MKSAKTAGSRSEQMTVSTPSTETRPAAEPVASSSSVQIGGKELEDHIRALRRYARALVGSSADSDDLVQETLKRALTYLPEGKEIRNLRAYLLTMLHHVRIDHAKRAVRNKDQLSLDDVNMPSIPASQLHRLECRELAEAIDQLPAEQREVLLLVCLEGLSYQETADLVGTPIGTVMSRLSRARTALRRMLSADAVTPMHKRPVTARVERPAA